MQKTRNTIIWRSTTYAKFGAYAGNSAYRRSDLFEMNQMGLLLHAAVFRMIGAK